MMSQLAEVIAQNKNLNDRLMASQKSQEDTASLLTQTRQAALILETQTNAELKVMKELFQEATSGTRSSSETKSMVDNKGLGTPKVFESEPKKFPTWAFKLVNWVSGFFPYARAVMEWSAAEGDRQITWGRLSHQFVGGTVSEVDLKRFDDQLYTVLADKTDGEALHITQNSHSKSGSEVWRRLSKRFDPQTDSRKRTLMSKILNPGQVTLKDLSDHIETWEKDLIVFEQRSGEDISDTIKIGILQELCPEALKEHLMLNASRFNTYDTVRLEIMNYLETKFASKQDSHKATPMDVGNLSQCPHCSQKKPKHTAAKCWSNPANVTNQSQGGGWSNGKGSWSAGGKSSGKGSKGKGKSGKGKGKGDGKSGGKGKGSGKKGKGKSDGPKCYNCGKPGHLAKNCWSMDCSWAGEGQEEWWPEEGHWTEESGKWTWVDESGETWNKNDKKPSQPEEECLQVGGMNCQLELMLNESHLPEYVYWHGERWEKNVKSVGMSHDPNRWHSEAMPPIVIDSGCSNSIMPKTLCQDYKVHSNTQSQNRTPFRQPDGKTHYIDGERQVRLQSEDGEVNMRVRFNVGDVKTVLMSVAELEESGWDLVISKRRGRYLEHAATGKRVNLLRHNGTYKLPPVYALKATGDEKVTKTAEENLSEDKTTENRQDEGFQWQPVGHV